jgi:hypothetical protein
MVTYDINLRDSKAERSLKLYEKLKFIRASGDEDDAYVEVCGGT